MTEYERQQVESIIWACYKVENGLHNDIPWRGQSIAGQIVDFKGDLPPPSNYKVESVSIKAQELSRYALTNFDKYSYGLLHSLPDFTRLFLLAPLRLQIILRKIPSGVRVAEFLDIDYDDYRNQKRRYERQVLKLDKMMSPHVYLEKSV